jgi:hypothetical protein
MVIPNTGQEKRDRMVELIMNLEEVSSIRDFMGAMK